MWRLRFTGEAARDGGKPAGKLTAGIPLTKLRRPRLATAAELVVHGAPRSRPAERFRELAAGLDAQAAPPAVVLVTSAGTAEGKSLVAINLALAWAAARPGKVLLLDCDLRRPAALGEWLHPAPTLGLVELLQERTELEHVKLEPINSPLHVLPSGPPASDPTELLSCERLENLVADLRRSYERIVVDTSPIVPFTDADLVARVCDGAIVVARAGQTRRSELLQAVAAVTAAPVFGTLLNDDLFDHA